MGWKWKGTEGETQVAGPRTVYFMRFCALFDCFGGRPLQIVVDHHHLRFLDSIIIIVFQRGVLDQRVGWVVDCYSTQLSHRKVSVSVCGIAALALAIGIDIEELDFLYLVFIPFPSCVVVPFQAQKIKKRKENSRHWLSRNVY